MVPDVGDSPEVPSSCVDPSVALGGIDSAGAVMPWNATMMALQDRLGVALDRAVEPLAPGSHELWVVGPTGVRLPLRIELATAEGVARIVAVQELGAAVVARNEVARVCAIRPLVPALVHELNNLLHVTLTVCDQFRETEPHQEDASLIERTEDFVRHMARVLATVRSLGVQRGAGRKRIELARLLDGAARIHGNFCLEAGVELGSATAPGVADLQIEVEQADLLAVVSQFLGHALATRGGDPDLSLRAERRGGLAGLAVLCGGDPDADEGLARMEAQPTLRIGARTIPGFNGDRSVLGGALVGLWLCGGGVQIGMQDGRRCLFAGAPVAAASR